MKNRALGHTIPFIAVEMGENMAMDKTSSKLSSKASHDTGSKISSTDNVKASISLSNASVIEPVTTGALYWSMHGDVEKLVHCFEDATDPDHEIIATQISERNPEDDRTPLDWASLLGYPDVVSELLKRGVDVNGVNRKGYSAAHFAAAWGQVDCLRVLVYNGADLLLKNCHDETPRDIAKRYEKCPCVQYMDWADAKKSLKECILAVKDQVAAADKVKGFTKEDKVGINAMITEQLSWLEKVTDDVPIDDFTQKKQIFNDYTQPIINKILNPEIDSKRPKSQKKVK